MGITRNAIAAIGLIGAAFMALAPPTSALAQDIPNAAANEELQRIDRLRELRQLELDTRLRANQDVPVGQRALVDYGAYISFNYLSLDDSVNENHILRETDLFPFARVNIDGAHEFFIRGIIGWRDFNDGDSFDGRGDEAVDGDIDRGYYRFDLRRYRGAYGDDPGNLNLVAQVGRDLVYWANGLVMSQVIDGAIVQVGNDSFNLELIGGITPVRTVDIDSSRPNFDHNTRRGFFGGLLSGEAGEHQPFVYFLAQQDYNQDDFRSTGEINTRYDYNSYYIGVGSSGAINSRLRYGVELAYEFGSTLSNSFELAGFGLVPVRQTTDDINAFGFDARLDYLFNDRNQTRLSAEFIFATGDTDRGHTSNTFNGNSRDTSDRSFNGFGLLNTGLAFAADTSNIMVLRAGLATFPLASYRPFSRLQVGTDVFLFQKFERRAPIDEPTGDERFLGFEPDVYLNWQVTSDVTFALRYGIFMPNSDNFAVDDVRHFFFAGVTYAF